MNFITKRTKDIAYWALREASKEGKLNSIISSGDIFPISLSNGKIVNFIVGKDSSNTYLIADECVANSIPMNSDNKTLCGWRETAVREWLNNKFFNMLPIEVRSIICTTVTNQSLRGMTSQSKDSIVVPSLTQVYGKGIWNEVDIGDEQIDIFKDPKNRIKFYGDKIEWWWSKTPYCCSIGEMRFGVCNDIPLGDISSSSHGIVPMFRI